MIPPPIPLAYWTVSPWLFEAQEGALYLLKSGFQLHLNRLTFAIGFHFAQSPILLGKGDASREMICF
jgi:hypothetical protein